MHKAVLRLILASSLLVIGSTRVVSGALDIKNKINESDEKNNSVKF